MMRLYLDIHVFLKFQLDLSGIKDQYGIKYTIVPFYGNVYYVEVTEAEYIVLQISDYANYISFCQGRQNIDGISIWVDVPSTVSYSERHEMVREFLEFLRGLR